MTPMTARRVLGSSSLEIDMSVDGSGMSPSDMSHQMMRYIASEMNGKRFIACSISISVFSDNFFTFFYFSL